jgi:hypothetical protein
MPAKKDVCEVFLKPLIYIFPSCHSKHVFSLKKLANRFFTNGFWTFIFVHFIKAQNTLANFFLGFFQSYH